MFEESGIQYFRYPPLGLTFKCCDPGRCMDSRLPWSSEEKFHMNDAEDKFSKGSCW
jgi:hypothetical protein